MRALGFDVKKQEVLAIMRDYDRDGAGQIEYPDFLEIMTTKISERDPVEEGQQLSSVTKGMSHTAYQPPFHLRRHRRQGEKPETD